MTGALHVVCPHCDGTNRVPQAKLSEAPKCGRCHQALFTGAPVAGRYGVQGIPALYDFSGGKVAARQSSLSDAAVLRRWVDRFAPVGA